MYKIKQHIPSYVSGFEPEVSSFSSLKELLTIPWIKKYKEVKNKAFCEFCYDDSFLMVIYNRGLNWWVVGRFLDPINFEEFGLTSWNGGMYKLIDDQGKFHLLNGREYAISTCGNRASLKDGRIMQIIED